MHADFKALGWAMMNRWTVFLFEVGPDDGSFTPKVVNILSVSRRTTGRMPAVSPFRALSGVVRLAKMKPYGVHISERLR